MIILVYLLLFLVFLISLAYVFKWMRLIKKHNLSKKVYIIQSNIKSPAYLVLAAVLICEVTSIFLFVENNDMIHGAAVLIFVLMLMMMYQYTRLVFYNNEGFVYQFTHTPYSEIDEISYEYDGKLYTMSIQSGAVHRLFKVREKDWICTMETTVTKT